MFYCFLIYRLQFNPYHVYLEPFGFGRAGYERSSPLKDSVVERSVGLHLYSILLRVVGKHCLYLYEIELSFLKSNMVMATRCVTKYVVFYSEKNSILIAQVISQPW